MAPLKLWQVINLYQVLTFMLIVKNSIGSFRFNIDI